MIKVVVPVSGGKDSQACLKMAVTKYGPEDVIGLYHDTDFDHPITHSHIQFMRELYGVVIHETHTGTVPEQCIKHGRFPSGVARFCTEELKIWPSKKFYRDLAIKQNSGFEAWIGVRANESVDRSKRYAGIVGDDVMPPHEFMRKYPKYLHKLGVAFRLPIVEWSVFDVMEYLEGFHNPLYDEGFDRVGCFPCLAAGDEYKEKAFKFDEFGKSQYGRVIKISNSIGKSVWTSKSGKCRNEGPGCSLCSM